MRLWLGIRLGPINGSGGGGGGGGDTTAPTLSSPTGTQTGATTGTSTVSTNEANGTLYSFLSASATPPTAANLKTGTGAVTSASQAVSATGVQTVNWAGLTASTTYYTHWLHRDAAGNDSAIVSGAGFTTAAPTTSSYTFAQGSAGLAGDLDKITDADRWSTFKARTIWAGYITGSAAYFTCRSQYAATGMIRCAVDGGAHSTPGQTGDEYTLFTGLSDAPHFVVISIQSNWDDQYILKTDTMFRVTGGTPTLAPFIDALSWGQNTSTFVSNIASVTRAASIKPAADFVPSIWSAGGVNEAWERNGPSVAFKTNATAFVIGLGNGAGTAYNVAVSVDGGAPTSYAVSGVGVSSKLITGLSGAHTYHVWASRAGDAGGQPLPALIISIKDGTFQTLTKYLFDQFGTSITASNTGTATPDMSEVFGVAANLGYVAQNHGRNGETILGLKNKIDALLANKTIGANDVCVLEIGENDAPTTTMDATKTTNYQYIVSALLTKGYRRILCRAPISDGHAGTQRALANSIQSIVAGYADARIKFAPTSGWTGISTSDGLHPNAAGYVTMRAFALADYPALLA